MPFNHKSNIVLIGMPGAGKSTVGVLLAKETGLAFLDSDLLIQTQEAQTLQEIVDQKGYIQLRAIEEQVLVDLQCENTVISTGGSAAYSEKAMQQLLKHGIVVFLDVTFPVIAHRIHNFGSRGIARRANQTLEDIFNERRPLYQKYAEITIECSTMDHEQVSLAIQNQLQSYKTQ